MCGLGPLHPRPQVAEETVEVAKGTLVEVHRQGQQLDIIDHTVEQVGPTWELSVWTRSAPAAARSGCTLRPPPPAHLRTPNPSARRSTRT